MQAELRRFAAAVVLLMLTTIVASILAPMWAKVLIALGAFLVLLMILTHYQDDAVRHRAFRKWTRSLQRDLEELTR